MWHKAEWMEHPMRLELTRVGLLVKLANHYTNPANQGYNVPTVSSALGLIDWLFLK